MKSDCGLYITISSSGKIKRDLATQSGMVSLDDSTVERELRAFYGLDWLPYLQKADFIRLAGDHIYPRGEDQFGEENIQAANAVLDLTDDFVHDLTEENSVLGTLTGTAVEDCLPENDGTGKYVLEMGPRILSTLGAIIDFQLIVDSVLQDVHKNTPLDFESRYPMLRRVDVTQIFSLEDGLKAQYYFRSPINYYGFLLLQFIAKKPRTAICGCCGQAFIPKTKKLTLYCDRVIAEGKTCKQLGPRIKHEIEVDKHNVVEEFDRAKQRMYKRYERSVFYNQEPTEKSLTQTEYSEWLEQATQARDMYLAGEMSEEEALGIINVP